MLTQTKKTETARPNQGFTIIEVMIVLAIAGLILLIVFLAVPALQRNTRNTQRKSDIGRVGSSVQNVISNNNGSLVGLTSANLQADLGTALSYYTTTNVTVVGAAPVAATNDTTVDTVNVYTDGTCTSFGTGQGATSTGATTRGVAIVYHTESGSGSTPDCISE
jgi:prepilin-type N-terminal cleavage/methylation domain-containing protein